MRPYVSHRALCVGFKKTFSDPFDEVAPITWYGRNKNQRSIAVTLVCLILWLYRECDVIWNELRLFLVEGWWQCPGVGPKLALMEKARNVIHRQCSEYASLKRSPYFKAWNMHYTHTVIHRLLRASM
jgi:hypothetical protein